MADGVSRSEGAETTSAGKVSAGEIALSALVPLYGAIAGARAAFNHDRQRSAWLPLISVGNLLALDKIAHEFGTVWGFAAFIVPLIVLTLAYGCDAFRNEK